MFAGCDCLHFILDTWVSFTCSLIMLRDPPWYVLFPIAGEGTEEAAAPGSAELLWVQGAGNTPKLAVPIQGSQHRFIFVNSQESLAL